MNAQGEDTADVDVEAGAVELVEPTGSSGARRKAIVILEVLGGMRSPTEAAEELAIPLPRYYQWEDRAVAGMIIALEPKQRGPRRDPQKELEEIRGQLEASRKECARYEALLRSAQRSLGLRSDERPPASKKKGKRRRSPRVRALTAIEKIERSTQSGDRGTG